MHVVINNGNISSEDGFSAMMKGLLFYETKAYVKEDRKEFFNPARADVHWNMLRVGYLLILYLTCAYIYLTYAYIVLAEYWLTNALQMSYEYVTYYSFLYTRLTCAYISET